VVLTLHRGQIVTILPERAGKGPKKKQKKGGRVYLGTLKQKNLWSDGDHEIKVRTLGEKEKKKFGKVRQCRREDGARDVSSKKKFSSRIGRR